MERFDDKRFLGSLSTGKFGRRLIHLPVIGSTNDYAAELISNTKAPRLKDIDGTLIISDKQTGGRGRFNRNWLSPPGGLWFSIIFMTVLPVDKIPSVTLIAAFSAADILISNYNLDINIKWPNDIYFKDRKLGGILSEQRRSSGLMFIIMGMGLNIDVGKTCLDGLENKASNIQDLTQKKIIPEILLSDILGNFEELYLYFSNTGDLGSILKKIEKILRF